MKPSKQEPKPKEKSGFDVEAWPYFTPVCFAGLFLVLVFLFSDFLFTGGTMLHGSDMINAGIQARTMLVDYVKAHGAVPQWDPYLFGGLPFVEAFHGDIFYPLSFLKYLGSVPRMIGFVLFFHIFLAGITMYFAGRQFKLSKIASLIAGSAYMFAPMLISLIAPGHDGKIFVTALYPLLMLYLDRSLTTSGFKSFLNFTITGGVIGLILLTPHPQMSYFMLWSLSFYVAFKLIMMLKDKKGIAAVIRPGVLTVYAVFLGLLIGAIQFYPGYYYTTHYSPRTEMKKGWDWAISWSMNEEEAFSLIIPDFVGTSTSNQSVKTYYWGKNAFKDNSESVVVAALFLAMIGLIFAHRREAYFFGGVALFALIYGLGGTTPIFKLFYWLIPRVDSLRAPSMIMYLFSFSIALLAGFGIQYLIDFRKSAAKSAPPGFYYVLLGFPALLLLLAFLFTAAGKGMLNLWTSLFFSSAPHDMVQQGVSKLDVAYLNLPAIQSGAWVGFLSVAAVAVFILLFVRRMTGSAVFTLVIFIIAIEGARFDSRFIEAVNPNQYWGPNPVANFLQKEPDHFRVLNLAMPTITANLLPYFQIPVVTGYHGNQLMWYADLLGGIERMNKLNPRFLNLVGARYLTLPAGQQIPDGYFGSQPTPVLASFGNVSIVKNENAFSRVFLADSVAVIPERSIIDMRVLGTDQSERDAADLRAVAYLEEEPPIPIEKGFSPLDSTWIVSYDFDTVVVGVNVTTNKLLVMADNYYDAWQVSIDGAPAHLMRAYGTFRAVAIPPGNHTVSFVFYSERYATGKAVTYASVLWLLGVVGFGIFKGRRKKEETKESQEA